MAFTGRACSRSNVALKTFNLPALVILVVLMSTAMVSCGKGGRESADLNKFYQRSIPEGGVHRLTVEGIVFFSQPVDLDNVKRVLMELYPGYVSISFSDHNQRGNFGGVLDQSACPRVERCVLGDDIKEEDDYFRFKQFCAPWAYYYMLAFDSLRIVNEGGEPYYYTGPTDFLNIEIAKQEGADRLAGENHVEKVMVDLFLFEKLGKNHTHRFISYGG